MVGNNDYLMEFVRPVSIEDADLNLVVAKSKYGAVIMGYADKNNIVFPSDFPLNVYNISGFGKKDGTNNVDLLLNGEAKGVLISPFQYMFGGDEKWYMFNTKIKICDLPMLNNGNIEFLAFAKQDFDFEPSLYLSSRTPYNEYGLRDTLAFDVNDLYASVSILDGYSTPVWGGHVWCSCLPIDVSSLPDNIWYFGACGYNDISIIGNLPKHYTSCFLVSVADVTTHFQQNRTVPLTRLGSRPFKTFYSLYCSLNKVYDDGYGV